MTRQPQVLVFSTIQPIIFVLMFRYVFGGAIRIPRRRPVRRLPDARRVRADRRVRRRSRPASVSPRTCTRASSSGSARLPMARSAVLAGPHARRPRAQRLRRCGSWSSSAISSAGASHTSVLGLLAGIGRDAVLRVLAHVDLRDRRPVTHRTRRPRRPRRSRSWRRSCSSSTAFVSSRTMPGPLKWFAEHQPVSIVIDAVPVADARRASIADPGKVVAVDPVERRDHRRHLAPLARSASYRRKAVAHDDTAPSPHPR